MADLFMVCIAFAGGIVIGLTADHKVPVDALANIEALCQSNGGTNHIVVSISEVQAVCNNKASFKLNVP